MQSARIACRDAPVQDLTPKVMKVSLGVDLRRDDEKWLHAAGTRFVAPVKPKARHPDENQEPKARHPDENQDRGPEGLATATSGEPANDRDRSPRPPQLACVAHASVPFRAALAAQPVPFVYSWQVFSVQSCVFRYRCRYLFPCVLTIAARSTNLCWASPSPWLAGCIAAVITAG